MGQTAPIALPGLDEASGRTFRVATVSLPKRRTEHLRYSSALDAVTGHLRVLEQNWGDDPAAVYLEEPFGAGQSHVHPSSNRTVGVILAAIGTRFPDADCELVKPTSWKKTAIGHGFADKASIMLWAREHAHYTGSLQDEADALGIAARARHDADLRGDTRYAVGIDPSTLRVAVAACWP